MIQPGHVLSERDHRKLAYSNILLTAGADPGFVFRRGCTRVLVYFNTNKPHSFFLQNTSCIRKPQVISGGGRVRTPCTLPLDPPLNSVPKPRSKKNKFASSSFTDERKEVFYVWISFVKLKTQ